MAGAFLWSRGNFQSSYFEEHLRTVAPENMSHSQPYSRLDLVGFSHMSVGEKIENSLTIPTFHILQPLKKTENQPFSSVFRGCKMRKLVTNGLTH